MEEYMFNAYFKQRTHIHYISRTLIKKFVNHLKKNGQKASQVLYKQVDLNQQETYEIMFNFISLQGNQN